MPLPLHDAPLRAPFPIGTMTFCVAAINRFVDQMLLAQGPYRNCLMFDLHKTECFNELAKLLESLPASSHDTSQSPVFYTTAVTKALRIPLTKKIGKRINETSKKFAREPSAPPAPPAAALLLSLARLKPAAAIERMWQSMRVPWAVKRFLRLIKKIDASSDTCRCPVVSGIARVLKMPMKSPEDFRRRWDAGPRVRLLRLHLSRK